MYVVYGICTYCRISSNRQSFTLLLAFLDSESITVTLTLGQPVMYRDRLLLTLRRRIKSHLLFAGIIRSSPFSPR